MDYSLQVHEAKYVFPIPDGLKELSSDIIREVLRHQPQNINGFVADYLETMLSVREHARESGVIICDVFREGYFFDELFRTKNVNREQANFYANIIQAHWRGYVVRKKIIMWLMKKKKFEEDRIRKKSLKIEELLAGLGITLDEAKRAAVVIQTAYKETKRGNSVPDEPGESWVEEVVPLGQRIREGDRALGRYDRWEEEDFGDFFEMDEAGAIKYVWPRVGQLRKVLREEVPKDLPIVEFFAMRDLNGQEQYSYLIQSQPETETRGYPVGFLVPVPKARVEEDAKEVNFVDPINAQKMGYYVYVFRDDLDRTELKKLYELLKTPTEIEIKGEAAEELEYDPNWVLPRVLVRIKKELLDPTDDEVEFTSLPKNVIPEPETYTLRAETFKQSAKIIRYILRNQCPTVEDAMIEAANMSPYKFQETGRIFPVDKFTYPSYIQKIEITPESASLEEESLDFTRYTYVFVPPDHPRIRSLPKGEPLFSISIIRFQGYHSDYKGSEGLENKVFIMGPRMTTPNGKPFTYESLFWEEFGIQAWHQLLFKNDIQEEIAGEEDFLTEGFEGEYPGENPTSLYDTEGEEETDKSSTRSRKSKSKSEATGSHYSEVTESDIEKGLDSTQQTSTIIVAEQTPLETEGENILKNTEEEDVLEKDITVEPSDSETKEFDEKKLEE